MNRKFTILLSLILLLCWKQPFLFAQGLISVSSLEKPVRSASPAIPGNRPDDRAGRGINILKYSVYLEPSFLTKSLYGKCTLTFEITDAIPDSTVRLNLVNLKVDSVTSGDRSWAFFQKDSLLFLQSPTGFQIGDTVSVTIVYQGYPTNDSFGGYFATKRIIYTVGEGLYTQPPSMTRRWIPSVDRPDAKALLKMTVRVPSGNIVGSNGLLIKVIHNSDQTDAFVWQEDFPIAPYLMSIGISKFARFNQVYVNASGDTLPIQNFVYPEDSLKAVEDFKNLPDMIRFFSQKFGPYPFKKYGMLEAPMGGAMEHQTLTTLSSFLITGDRRYEGIIAHELGHQWWGDCVTLADWGDIWLNEGFATYSDALYTEHAYGEKAFRAKMDGFAALYFREDDTVGRFPIYDPQKMWGATVYEKGAWVLHMLRGVVGDSVFFEIMRSYRSSFEYGNATIADFQQAAESVSGEDLDWFFHEWLFEAGYPIYQFRWQAKPANPGGTEVVLNIRQIQTKAPLFRMPIQFGFDFEDTTFIKTIHVNQDEQNFHFTFNGAPSRVVFDPNQFVLKKLYNLSTLYPPEEFRLLQSYPNPFYAGESSQKIIIVFWTRSKYSQYYVQLKIYNSLGQIERILVDGKIPPGYHERTWRAWSDEGRPVPAGVYFCVLTQGNETQTRKIVVVR